MARTKAERLGEVFDRAAEGFDRAYPSQREIRLQCLQDRRFVSVPGAQWEGDLGEQFANRPRFEVNKIHMSVMRIFNEYRNNRISVDFRPKDNGASEEMADVLDGLYRADERECNAQEAYDNAFDEAVSGGMGAWRYLSAYENDEDPEDDRQRIKIEPIYEADSSVFFDIDAKKQDKADARQCWVLYTVTPDEYERLYGEEAPTSFDKVDRLTEFDWFQPDVVYLAEYYEIEEERKTVNVYLLEQTGEELKLDEDDEEESEKLIAMGYILARQKTIKTRRVHKYIIDGNRVVKDCGRIAGKHIPIVPVYGKRAYIDNVERIQGHVRLTTDLMRLYNMLISLLAEISVHSPISKPIVTPEQIQGHEYAWARDNIDRNPYLMLNPVTDASGQMSHQGPVGMTQPPQIPPGLAALLQLANTDMQELLGNGQNGDEMMSNISAKAVELIQTRIDMQSFIYMDNFAKGMKRGGEIWLDMAKDLYDEEGRVMKTAGIDGAEDEVELMRPIMGDEGMEYENDLSNGRFSVITDVGPSFTSRRDGTVRALTSLLQYTQDPTERAAITGVVLQNVDGEGLADLKDWNRKRLVRAGIVKPNDAEKEEMQAEAQNAQPDAQTLFLQAEAQKAQALGIKAQADTTKSLAEAEKTNAETAKILTDTDSVKIEQILTMLSQLQAASQQPQQAAQQPTQQPANTETVMQP